jgi:hypothetical protein
MAAGRRDRAIVTVAILQLDDYASRRSPLSSQAGPDPAPYPAGDSISSADRSVALRRSYRFLLHPHCGIGNRPAHFQPNPPVALSMRLLPAIFANIVLFAAALGFGNLLRRLFPKTFSPIDRFAFMLLGGLGLLGTVLFCVGQFWFSRTAIILILLFGLVLVAKPAARALRNSRTTLFNVSRPAVPFAVVAVVLVVTAMGGLALPTGDMNHDSIAYHYLGPKVWLRDHQIHPVPDEILTSFPVAVETQYAALMSLGGQRAPGFFAVIGLVSLLFVTATLAARLGLRRCSAWWTAALLVTMPALYRGAYGGFIDVLFAAFILAAARMAFDSETPRQYALFGFFCGIALGSKYTAVISVLLLVLCSFVISLSKQRQAYAVVTKHLAISCAVAVFVASPFYIRNWILFGCPIYPPPPVLLHFFAVKSFPPSVLHELGKNVRETGIGMGSGIRNFLLLPFNLTYHTANFRGAGGIGLVPLALGPIGLWAARRDVFAKGLILFAILQTAAWFATAQVSRYLIPVYVLAALIAVLGWERVAGGGSQPARLLSVLVVACSIIYGFIMIVPDRRDDLHAALSSSFEAQRSLREIPFLESFDYINREPSVSKVLVLNLGVPTYYLDKSYVKPLGRWGEQTPPDTSDPNKLLNTLALLHFSHVLDVKWPAFYFPDPPPGLALVFQRGNQRVYRVD